MNTISSIGRLQVRSGDPVPWAERLLQRFVQFRLMGLEVGGVVPGNFLGQR